MRHSATQNVDRKCAICHEITNAVLREEDHNTLNSNMLSILESHAEVPNVLETQRGKVDSMSSKLLRAFLHEFYAVTHDRL